MTEPIEEFAPELEPPAPQEYTGASTILRELFDARSKWGYAVIVIALMIGVGVLNRNATEEPSAAPRDTSAAIPNQTATVPVAESVPVPTTGSGLLIEIKAQDHCWVRAVVDGQPTFARLLQPGETQSLNAQRDIVLRVGDPAAFSYSVNGRTGESLGSANQPVTVRFGSDGHASRVS